VIKGDYDYLQSLAKYNVCAVHKKPLEVAWSSREKCYFLRCGEGGTIIETTLGSKMLDAIGDVTFGHSPDVITRNLSLTQEYKAGADIPEPIKSNIKKSMRRRHMSEDTQKLPMTLEGLPGKDLATGDSLSPDQVRSLIAYAYKYHLDPYRGHVMMMYGKPYIGIDGYLFHARKLNVSYSLDARPMTTTEAKIFKIGKLDHGWIAWVTYLADCSTFTGTGIVTYDEMIAKSPTKPDKLRSPVVATHPWQLAQKRAEWQAMRKHSLSGRVGKKKKSSKRRNRDRRRKEEDREGEGGKIHFKSLQPT